MKQQAGKVSKLQKAVRGALRALRQRIRRAAGDGQALLRRRFPDVDDAALACAQYVKPYTLTSLERILALRQAVQYVVHNEIAGDIVECGVWRGGSMMAVARTLIELRALRRLYLFDTFEGMPPPAEVDRDYRGRAAAEQMAAVRPIARWMKSNATCAAPVMTRARWCSSRGRSRIRFRRRPPTGSALLRLDTDWYESTYHEMRHLYPRLVVGGVLIIDDYGHWQGARRAVDQYIQEQHLETAARADRLHGPHLRETGARPIETVSHVSQRPRVTVYSPR